VSFLYGGYFVCSGPLFFAVSTEESTAACPFNARSASSDSLALALEV